MSENLCLVGLDPMLGDQKKLAKRADDSFLSKTYRQLVKYMLDSEPDPNNEAYNASQREATQIIKEWFEEARQNPKEKTVNVKVLTTDSPPQEILVDLDDIVSKYSDRTLMTMTREEDGKPVEYKALEMNIRPGTSGGYTLNIVDYLK